MTASLDIEVVSSLGALEGLERDWNGLQDACEHQHVMGDHRWALAWWRHFGAQARQRTLVLSRGGRRVGILPLALTRGLERFPLRDPYVTGPQDYRHLPDLRFQRVLPLRRLTFPLGIATGNVRGRAIFPERADELTAAAARHAAASRHEWDVAVWPGLRAAEGEDTRLANAARHAELRVGTRRSVRSLLSIDLPGTLDAFFAERSRKFRKDTRQESNRLARTFAHLGEMGVSAHRKEDTAPALETMFALERQSWKVRDEKERRLRLELDDTMRAFFREVVARFAAADQAQVTILRFGDTPAAALLSIERAGTTALILTYRNEQLGERVAMTPLWSEFVRLAIERGTRRIDVNGYTRNYLKWSKSKDDYVQLLLYNDAPYSRTLHRLDEGAIALARWVAARREARERRHAAPDAQADAADPGRGLPGELAGKLTGELAGDPPR